MKKTYYTLEEKIGEDGYVRHNSINPSVTLFLRRHATIFDIKDLPATIQALQNIQKQIEEEG
jgi:hypothetical protein